MSAHAIDIFNFEFWRSNAPQLPGEQVASHNRPGADGTGLQRLGQWRQAFEATVVGHYQTYALAMVGLNGMRTLAGGSAVPVVFNNLNYLAVFGVNYFVQDVSMVSAAIRPRLKGPGYDFIQGTEMTVSFILVPNKAT